MSAGAEGAPAWGHGQAQAGQVSEPARVGRRTDPRGFSEPLPWPDDGGVRREAVLDTDHRPPRVVRRVGWCRCLRCGRSFFSADVVRHRMCGGPEGCREKG